MELCNGDGSSARTETLGALPLMQLSLESTLLGTTAQCLLHALSELLGEDGIEEGVAASIDGEDENDKPFGDGGVDQLDVKDGC